MNRQPSLALWSWLLIGVVLLGGSVAVSAVLLRSTVGGRSETVRTTAPAITDFKLSHGGDYYIYHEFSRTVDSKGSLRPPGIDRMSFSLQHLDSGDKLTLEITDPPRDYAIRRRVGESIYRFSAAAPGTYRLVSTYPEESLTTPYDLVISESFGGRMATGLFQVVVILASMIVLVVGAMVFGRSKKFAEATAADD